MSQQGNSVNGNQSLVTEGAIEGALDDLTVQNTDAIKGGPNQLINEFLVDDKYVAASARALGGLTSK